MIKRKYIRLPQPQNSRKKAFNSRALTKEQADQILVIYHHLGTIEDTKKFVKQTWHDVCSTQSTITKLLVKTDSLNCDRSQFTFDEFEFLFTSTRDAIISESRDEFSEARQVLKYRNHSEVAEQFKIDLWKVIRMIASLYIRSKTTLKKYLYRKHLLRKWSIWALILRLGNQQIKGSWSVMPEIQSHCHQIEQLVGQFIKKRLFRIDGNSNYKELSRLREESPKISEFEIIQLMETIELLVALNAITQRLPPYIMGKNKGDEIEIQEPKPRKLHCSKQDLEEAQFKLNDRQIQLISDSFEGRYVFSIMSSIEAPTKYKWVYMLQNIS